MSSPPMGSMDPHTRGGPGRPVARRSLGALVALMGLAGCASVDLSAGLPDVRREVEAREGATIAWSRGAELDPDVASAVQDVLRKPLTADNAVRVALLNNRGLQALYSDLGVAQAELVQAGLFRNPMLDAAVLLPLSGARPDLQLTVVFGVLDALFVPLRARVAAAQLEETKLRVTGAVLDFAGRVRAAFIGHQADDQVRELRHTIAQALAASYEASRRLHEAGNITDLDLARARAEMEGAKLRLRLAEVAARRSREEVSGLMGTWGDQAGWEIDGRLPEVPAEDPSTAGIEGMAVARSVALLHARQRIVAAGQQLGYDRATALTAPADLGAQAEREEGWKVGPVVSVPLPLFDRGQTRLGRAAAELRRAEHEYYALAVRTRTTARAIREGLQGARDRALYYRDILLPLQERIVNESQLQYNAMQVGIFQLLRDRERQIETAVEYVEALREYWLARADLALAVSGRLPGSGDQPGSGATRAMTTQERRNGH
jgi:cobalt-zinc-cadmium efflux system outer membrane protein